MLRPEYQIPRFAPEQAREAAQIEQALDESAAPKPSRGRKQKSVAAEEPAAPIAATPWPATAVEQIAAIGALVAQQPRSAAEVSAAFAGAQASLVVRHLETLALMGEVTGASGGRYLASRRLA